MASTAPDASLSPDIAERNGETSSRAGYWLERLRRNHPEVAQRVESGEISAYQGAIEVGLRKRPDAVEEIQRRVSALNREDFRRFFVWALIDAKRRRV